MCLQLEDIVAGNSEYNATLKVRPCTTKADQMSTVDGAQSFTRETSRKRKCFKRGIYLGTKYPDPSRGVLIKRESPTQEHLSANHDVA